MQVGYVGLLKAIGNFDPAVCGSLRRPAESDACQGSGSAGLGCLGSAKLTSMFSKLLCRSVLA